MKRKIFSLLLISSGLLMACGGGKKEFKVPESKAETVTGNVFADQYDPNRGHGKYNFDNLKIDPALDIKMAERGEKLANGKCKSCHSIGTDTLKGPGWQGVTRRRTAHWLMNYITNPDPMLDQDPKLQAAIQLCNMRMPNLKVTDAEARDILEFLRKNDGVK
ncbi:MAG: cytochrome c [Ferruginibacter sp.]